MLDGIPTGAARAGAGRQDRRPGRPRSASRRASPRRAGGAAAGARRRGPRRRRGPGAGAARRRPPARRHRPRHGGASPARSSDTASVCRTSWCSTIRSPSRASSSRAAACAKMPSRRSSGTNVQNIRCPVPIVQARHCSASSKTTGSVSRTVRTSTAPAAVAIAAMRLVAAERGVAARGCAGRRAPPGGRGRTARRPLARCRPASRRWSARPARPGAAAGASRAAPPPAAGRKNSTSEDASTSKGCSGSRSAVASPSSTETWSSPAARAAARVCSTIAGDTSRAVTEPVPATARASGSVTAPRPHPTSTTRSPGRGSSSSTRPLRDRREERDTALVVVVGDRVEDLADTGHQLGGRRCGLDTCRACPAGAGPPWPARAVRVRPPRRALPGSAPRRR